jgi:transposase-like protein
MTGKQRQRSGRRHRSRAQADRLAAEYDDSGLSREEFCRQHDVSLKSLSRYVTGYRKRKTEGDEPQWVEVEVTGHSGQGSELAVVLGSGRKIEVRTGFDPHTLRQLVDALERG